MFETTTRLLKPIQSSLSSQKEAGRLISGVYHTLKKRNEYFIILDYGSNRVFILVFCINAYTRCLLASRRSPSAPIGDISTPPQPSLRCAPGYPSGTMTPRSQFRSMRNGEGESDPNPSTSLRASPRLCPGQGSLGV
jgi:hypothetical protein